jgi:hypothetical protein
MARATERWQDAVRYQVDTSSMPMPQRSLLRLGRLFFLVVLGVVLTLAAFATFASRGPAPASEPSTRVSPTRMAHEEPQPGKKRSLTPKTTAEASHSDGGPKAVRVEPQSPQVQVAEALKQVTLPDPASTGAIPSFPVRVAERNLPEPGPRKVVERRILRQTRHSAEGSKEVGNLRSPEAQSSVRKSGAVVKRTAERAAPPQAAAPRLNAKPQALVVRAQPDRIAAAVPARSMSICLYFVVCF